MKGFNYLKKAADQGDVSACYFLGFSHHRGLFENDNPNAKVPTTSKPGEGGAKLCEKDVKKALEYLEKAGDGGHSKALLYLYQMYHNGEEVEKDVMESQHHHHHKGEWCGDLPFDSLIEPRIQSKLLWIEREGQLRTVLRFLTMKCPCHSGAYFKYCCYPKMKVW